MRRSRRAASTTSRARHADRGTRRERRPAAAAPAAAPRARRSRELRDDEHAPERRRSRHGSARQGAASPVAGKTGTSNLSKDTWFAGYTTDIAAVVWVGYDDGKPLGAGASEQGAVTALPAWVSFMKVGQRAQAGRASSRARRGLSRWRSTRRAAKLPYAGDTDTLNEVFLAGTEPTEVGNPYLDDARRRAADGGHRGG